MELWEAEHCVLSLVALRPGNFSQLSNWNQPDNNHRTKSAIMGGGGAERERERENK